MLLIWFPISITLYFNRAQTAYTNIRLYIFTHYFLVLNNYSVLAL